MSTISPTLEIVNALPTLARRAVNAHKGDFGRILVVAGSRGMSGAAVLCGSAALRSGAGLVKVAVPAEVLQVVAAGNACYTTAPLPHDADGRLAESSLPLLLKLADAHDVLAVGPGLDRSDELSTLVADVVTRVAKPIVLDADGLNALIGQTDKLRSAAGPRILTPHPGEFARLLQKSMDVLKADRRNLAVEFARDHRCILVLKGHLTLVTDGRRVYENATGNPGMATGGTGDVLTGVIAALIGQGLSPFEAAQLGAHVHGLAGDRARDAVGEVSLIASDLLIYLPQALKQL
jgi:NAD(P)H-hydrate epimerase